MIVIACQIVLVYLLMYYIIFNTLKYISPTFCELDYLRKLYIVKNYVKSIVLCVFSYRAMLQTYYILVDNGQLNTEYTNTNALIYVLTDTVGLILVRNLPLNTKIHHLTTNLLGIYIVSNTHEYGSSIYLPVLYAGFSSLSFIVNFYLAFRAHSPTNKYRSILSYTSYLIYVISSILNWFVQIYYLLITMAYGEMIFPFMYCFCLIAIISDDLILMKWLKNDSIKLTDTKTN